MKRITAVRDEAESGEVNPRPERVPANGRRMAYAVDRVLNLGLPNALGPEDPNPFPLPKLSGQVAVVFQNFGQLSIKSPYRLQVMNGVMSALFPRGYSLALCPNLNLGREPGSPLSGQFDGILWCRPDFSEAEDLRLGVPDLPIVMLHAPPGSIPGIPSFCADNDAAMRKVVDHLKSLGHRRLAFVIDPVSAGSVEGQVRFDALCRAANVAGLPLPDRLIVEEGHQILARYGSPGAPHSALVCFSDEFARSVLPSLASFGVSVPKHLSVVGFDSSPICQMTEPHLTSVSQPVERMAFDATSHLLSLIHAACEGCPPSSAVSSLYDCGLDVRASTAPPFAH